MSQTYTFTKIFSTPIPHSSEDDLVTISKIVIPRIQRPYAQGRSGESEKKIRESFLKEIFKNLKNSTPMDMNFVYGAVKEIKDKDQVVHVMELLDGQQRLTTLYLLHWYLLNKEYKQEDSLYDGIKKALSSFIYETRTTVTKFCKSLSNYACSLEDIKPSERITHARWYYHSYDKDSTISGMLVMLDAIDVHYKALGLNDLLSKVNLLQFYILPLMQYDKSEELYMKMNARGLPLSVFDNFKADFTGIMSKVPTLNYEMVKLTGGVESEKVSHCENISIKLDAKWIDLFWNNEKKKDADISYMRFFSRFFACRYLIDSPLPPREMRSTEVAVNMFYTQTEKSKGDYLGFDEYAEELALHPEYFEAIEKILDTLYAHYTLIEESLIPAWETEGKGNFFIDVNATFTQTLLTVMGAILEFILSFKTFDEIRYKEWMRVVWNIVENTDIDNLERVATTLRSFARMIRYIADALDNESEFSISRERVHDIKKTQSFFEAMANCANLPTADDDNRWTRPFKEEMEKAKRISENKAWYDQIIQMEKHLYFKGTTNFYYTEDMSLDKFIHRCDLIAQMFDVKGITKDYRKRHVLIRALMSRLTTWQELERQYVTENSETHKFLKILLINNKNIHELLADILDRCNDKEEVINELEEATKKLIPYEGKSNWALSVAIACNILRKDIKLYNWMMGQSSPVYVHWKNGHIAVAIPGKWFDRYFIDSERDKMAQKLIEVYGLHYFEDESTHTSLADYKTYGHYKGENVILYLCNDGNDTYSFNVDFSNNHVLRIYIETPSKAKAKMFCNLAGSGFIYDDDACCVYYDPDENGVPLLYYYTTKNLKKIMERIEAVLEIAKDTITRMPVK